MRWGPNRFLDPLGLDIAVIEQGPTEGNPIGHTAMAITGQGVYSYGNSTPAGSSLQQYLAREAPRRDTRVYIVPTSPVQDRAAMQYLRGGTTTYTGVGGASVGKYSFSFGYPVDEEAIEPTDLTEQEFHSSMRRRNGEAEVLIVATAPWFHRLLWHLHRRCTHRRVDPKRFALRASLC